MEFKDYYAILGLSPDADEQAIKQAYRKLARQYHPDVNPGDKKAEERFKEINEAYQALSDPERRNAAAVAAISIGASGRLHLANRSIPTMSRRKTLRTCLVPTARSLISSVQFSVSPSSGVRVGRPVDAILRRR